MSDVGLEALAMIHKELLIDEGWTERGDRSFAWIGHRLKQTVRAGRIIEDQDILLSRVLAETVVVEDVEAPEDDVLHVLASLNRHALGSAYSYRPDDKQVVATAGAAVHAATIQWRASQLGGYVIAQLGMAESEADYLAERTGGSVAVRGHEVAGERDEADDMLGVVEDVFACEGRAASKFENKFELDTIADVSRGSRYAASTGASATDVALEMPYAEETSLAVLDSRASHRRVGNGLLVRLHLPTHVSEEDAARIAGFLNRQEALPETDTLHYGAWSWVEWPNGRRAVTYRMFVPNRFHLPGVSMDISHATVGRARWADRLLNGRESTVNPWEVLAQRHGQGADDE